MVMLKRGLHIILLVALLAVFAPTISTQAQSDTAVYAIDYDFTDAGVWLEVEFAAPSHANRQVEMTIWFQDANGDDWLYNAFADSEDEYATPSEYLVTTDIFTATGNTQAERLYIPYNRFPTTTFNYSYYPQVALYDADTNDQLANVIFRDDAVRVLGDENPAGYIVNFRIKRINVHYTAEQEMTIALDASLGEEPLLTYGIYEITADGEEIPGEGHLWTAIMVNSNTYYEDSPRFLTLYLDVLADSTLVVDLELSEIDDASALNEYVEQMDEAERVARRAAQRITHRTARIAARSVGRYMNGLMLWRDFVNLFTDKSPTVYGSPRELFTPEDMLSLWRNSQSVGDFRPFSIDIRDEENNSFYYEVIVEMYLHGYSGQIAVNDAPPPPPPTAVPEYMQCPGTLPSRLRGGSIARITPGAANNLRAEPTLSSELVGTIPGDAEIIVVTEVPECADGMAWWYVEDFNSGVTGWTSEGNIDGYWITPE